MVYQACLIDVYDTLLGCDFASADRAISSLAGVELAVWQVAFRELGARVTDGRMSMGEVFAEVLGRSGVASTDERLRQLVRLDAEQVRAASTLYDDTMPFLESLRRKGVRTAIVSNCAENTRPLLVDLGLADLVDAVVLSCEVGCAKPDRSIYREALARIGASPRTTLLIDDQISYCHGAVAEGIHAIRIHRGGIGSSSEDGVRAVTTLDGLEALF